MNGSFHNTFIQEKTGVKAKEVAIPNAFTREWSEVE
jgi:hypothetical protein